MADFLRISSWSALTVRDRLRARQVSWALADAGRTGVPRVIHLNLDDSLGVKHAETQPYCTMHAGRSQTLNYTGVEYPDRLKLPQEWKSAKVSWQHNPGTGD
jgi:hypothetical protein